MGSRPGAQDAPPPVAHVTPIVTRNGRFPPANRLWATGRAAQCTSAGASSGSGAVSCHGRTTVDQDDDRQRQRGRPRRCRWPPRRCPAARRPGRRARRRRTGWRPAAPRRCRPRRRAGRARARARSAGPARRRRARPQRDDDAGQPAGAGGREHDQRGAGQGADHRAGDQHLLRLAAAEHQRVQLRRGDQPERTGAEQQAELLLVEAELALVDEGRARTRS